MKKSKKIRKSIKVKLIVIPLVLVLVAILGIGGISSYFMRNSLLEQMRVNGFDLVSQVANQVKAATTSLETINLMTENSIRSVGRVVISTGEQTSNEVLIQLAKDLNVDEINIYNENAEILYSNQEGNLGWVAPSTHLAQSFAKDKSGELMEVIRQSLTSNDSYKYGYIRGTNGRFVQVGVLANEVQRLSEQFSFQTLVEELAQHDNVVSGIFIDRNLKAIAHSDQDKIGDEINDSEVQKAISERKPYSKQFYYEEEGANLYDVFLPIIIEDEYIGTVNVRLSMESVYDAINKNMIMITFIGLITFILLGIILYVISNYVVKALEGAKSHLEFVASGDFTVEIPLKSLKAQDEFGEISNTMMNMQNSIREMIENISVTSQQVASSSEELTNNSQQSAVAAEEVAKTIEEIAKGATEQARDAEEGVVHIDELGNLIEHEIQYLEELNVSTDEISKLKDEGFIILKELVDKTNLSSNAAKEINKTIINTNESAEKIQSASQMIKNIADQTNLLALNAAIEAARAGDAGRGFAVVADEIRKLAEQSNKFTEEISDVIGELMEKTRHAVSTMQEVGSLVSSQNKSVEMTYNKFEGIASAIEKTKEVITAINLSAQHMEDKKNGMISIIQNLSAISEENAAGTQQASAAVEEQTATIEELANASQSLTNLALDMQKSIAKFKF